MALMFSLCRCAVCAPSLLSLPVSGRFRPLCLRHWAESSAATSSSSSTSTSSCWDDEIDHEGRPEVVARARRRPTPLPTSPLSRRSTWSRAPSPLGCCCRPGPRPGDRTSDDRPSRSNTRTGGRMGYRSKVSQRRMDTRRGRRATGDGRRTHARDLLLLVGRCRWPAALPGCPLPVQSRVRCGPAEHQSSWLSPESGLPACGRRIFDLGLHFRGSDFALRAHPSRIADTHRTHTHKPATTCQ